MLTSGLLIFSGGASGKTTTTETLHASTWDVETGVWSLGRQNYLEEDTAAHSSMLAWRVPWTEEPGGLQPRELERVGQLRQSSRYARKGFYSSLFPPSSLNQILYDYAVEMRNRFKGLDLLDRVPEELWMDVSDVVQETGIKTIPKKRNAKMQNGCLRRHYK